MKPSGVHGVRNSMVECFLYLEDPWTLVLYVFWQLMKISVQSVIAVSLGKSV